MIVNAYSDLIFHPAPGSPSNGHHYINLYVDISSYGLGSRFFYFLDGGLIGEASDTEVFKLPHSICCNPGCGYVIKVEERDSGGVTVLNTVIAPEVILCPPGDLFSAQNPLVLTCNPTAGTNVPIQVQSVPAAPGYTIRAYLDGDSTYAIIASATTNGSGIATVVIPTAVTGQKYWFSEEISGRKESFFNSVVIGGVCQNMLLNESFVCGVGGGTVTFAVSGGSGDYSMSMNNNDVSGYYAITPTFLPNGINQIYIRDNTNHAYKVMYSVAVNCGAPSAPSAPPSSPSAPPSAPSAPSAPPSFPPSAPSGPSSSARLRSADDVDDYFALNTTPQTLASFDASCGNNYKYVEKTMSVHSMNDRMSLVFPYYKFKRRITGKLLSGVYELYLQYESANGHKSVFHKYKNRVFVTSNPIDGSLPNKLNTAQIPNAYKSNHHNRQMGASGEVTKEGLQWEVYAIDTRWDYINFVYVYYESDVEPLQVREFSHTKITGSSILIDLVENIGEPVSKEKLSQRFQNILSARTTVEEDARKIDLGIEYLPEITVDVSSVNIVPKTRLLEADFLMESNYPAEFNPVSRKNNNSPITNTPTRTKTISVSRRTGDFETLDIIDDYDNYKGQQVESSLIGNFRGETYPYGIVLIDNKGNRLFSQPVMEFTFPEQFAGGGSDFSLTQRDSLWWKTKILGAIINGIKLDPNKIYKKSFNPITCTYELTNELLVSGFMIVRGDRFKTIEHQGVVFNTVEVEHVSTNDKKDTRVYPLPTAENTFENGYSAGNQFQYGDGHRWIKTNQPTTIASQVGTGGAGVGKSIANSCPYWVTYHSPDIYIEGKIKDLAEESDKLQHIGMVHKGYLNNQTELTGNQRHYYTKNYNTLNLFGNSDPLTVNGRPKLGDSTRIEARFEIEKTFETDYLEFDAENPYKIFKPGVATFFQSNHWWGANCNRDTVVMKLKDVDAVDLTRNIVNDYASYRLMNYKVVPEGIDRENIQYYSIGHFQQITQEILDSVEKELNPDGSVRRYVFNNIEVWGGDCYVNYFDFSRLYPLYSQGCTKRGDPSKYPDYAISHILPIESKYNLALRFGRCFAKNATQPQFSACETVPSLEHFSDGIMNQQPEEWGYNKALNIKERVSFYQQKPVDQVIISSDEAGYVHSPVKLYGAKEDAYRNNLLLDYGSVNGTNGKVVRAVKAHSYIYVVQERGFGVLPINQKAFIPSSEGEIVLGSGKVIGKVNYISNIYGSQHPASVWVNNNYIGFVDARMGKQTFFSQAGLAKMSTNNNMDDLVIASTLYNEKDQQLLPYLNRIQNIVAVYDFEHEEVLTSFIAYPHPETKGFGIESVNSFCLAYSPELSVYTQFFDYTPKIVFNIGRYLFSSISNKVLLHNYGKYGWFYDRFYKSIVRFIVNPSPTVSKIFDNGFININSGSENRIGDIYHKTQNETHKIVLNSGGNPVDEDAEFYENYYRYCMHEQDDLGLKARLMDQYVEVTIEVNNADQLIDGLDKRVVIDNFDTKYRISNPTQYDS